jgi:hypothetical protein
MYGLALKISSNRIWSPALKKDAEYDEEALHRVEDLRNSAGARGVAEFQIPDMHGFSN